MKRIKATYFDNYNMHTDEMYNAYLEYCKENDLEAKGDNSSDYFEFIADCEAQDWDDLWTNFKYSKLSDVKCVVLGTVGRWTGQHDVVPTVFDSLHDAVWACIRHCDYIKITQDCLTIRVKSTHHDGTNYFDIKFLNDRGCNTENGNLNNRRYHLTLTDYLF